MWSMAVQLIYSGLVGEQSYALIEYLEAVPGVQPIKAGENPATWMLEVTGGASVTGKSKAAAKVDFAEYYKVTPSLTCCDTQSGHQNRISKGPTRHSWHASSEHTGFASSTTAEHQWSMTVRYARPGSRANTEDCARLGF